MQFCIFEDQQYINFLPLVYFRPVYELRCGALSLREKIESLLPGRTVSLHCRQDHATLFSEEHQGRPVNVLADQDSWFINGRLIADDSFTKLLKKKPPGDIVYRIGGEIAAAFLGRTNARRFVNEQFADTGPVRDLPSEPLTGVLMHYPWELVQRTAEEIERDCRILKKRNNGTISRGRVPAAMREAHLLNKKKIDIGKNSVIKAGAVLDAEHGSIIIGKNVLVMPNAVIEGPAFIGDYSTIKIGAKIYHGTSIGEHCKVGGEVEASIIQSYSNKQHDGYLGHSYLGSWINIGADTNTSDLKNTYGTVRVSLNGEPVETGLQFVGLTMGDHSKTGINVMFDTGTVVGVSCNVYGAGLPPKFLPSYSWGGIGSWTACRLEKSLETARRVMARRNVSMSQAYEKMFREVFRLTQDQRAKAGVL